MASASATSTATADPGRQKASSRATQKVLPVKRVRLYETGVAYFERSGRMQAGQNLALPVPAGHLDDALKTLVVLSPGGQARLGAVAFESAVSEGAARAFAGLPDEGDEQLDYEVVLRSLEGQRVELQLASGTRRGRLVRVEGPLATAPVAETQKSDAASPVPPTPVLQQAQWDLIVVDTSGSILRIRSDELRGIRPLEAGARDRIELAAASLAGQSAQRTQSLSLQVQRAGEVELGYVAEAPVWRTSYRVVLTDDGAAVMQAWALIHNDSDEAWRDVRVELANGEPASFLFPLAAPRYARRELRAPEVDLFTVPQLLLETADGMWADGSGYAGASGSIGLGGVGLMGRGAGGGGSGAGYASMGTVGTVGASSLELGDLADFAQADGSESEAQFVYRLAQGVDLLAHHTALVPVFAQSIDARSITLFSGASGEAMYALRLVNSTAQSLPAGPVALFADGGFAGEATIDRLKSGEPRYLVFGKDLDVELTRSREAKGRELAGLTFSDGQLHAHYVDRFELNFRVVNRSKRARNAYVALNLPRNAEIRSEAPLDWDPQRGEAMVSIGVPGHRHAKARVRAGTPVHEVHAPESVSREQLAGWLSARNLPTSTRELLEDGLEAFDLVARIDAALASQEEVRIRREQELIRRRADLAALAKVRQGGESARKAAKRIEALEQALAAARVEVQAAGRRREHARTRGERRLQALPASLPDAERKASSKAD